MVWKTEKSPKIICDLDRMVVCENTLNHFNEYTGQLSAPPDAMVPVLFVIAITGREFKQTDDEKLHVKDLFPTGNGSLGSMSYLPWSSPDKYTLWTD